MELATNEFESVKQQVVSIFSDIRLKLEEALSSAASLLARMSAPQLQQMAAALKPYRISARTVQSLALVGRGEMPKWIAFNQHLNIAPSFWQMLPKEDKKRLQSPDAELELRTESGIVVKRAADCTPFEFSRAVKSSGIVPAEKQKLLPELERPQTDDAGMFESARLVDDGKTLLVIASDGQKIKCPLKALRKVLA